jgi:hypothetical protein
MHRSALLFTTTLVLACEAPARAPSSSAPSTDLPADAAVRVGAPEPSAAVSALAPAVSALASTASSGRAASAAAPIHEQTAQPPQAPATVERLEIAGGPTTSIVRARDGKPPRIVFFPGICSNAGAYLHGFTEAAATHGGALAIDGEKPCGASGDFHSISSDPVREEKRLDAALDAAGVPLEQRSELLHVGYSLGATLLENLVKKDPARYRHVVLIGSPKDPRKDRLEKATTVATMSCSLDVPQRMKGAVRMLEQAGVRAKYFEMPGCTHGNLADGDAVFGDVFTWLRKAP